MSIDFACPNCQKKYRVKDELAGKSAKCSKCNHRLKVPEPALVEELDLEEDLGNWMDDELSTAMVVPAETLSSSSISGGKHFAPPAAARLLGMP